MISIERGHDPREFTLVSFGGAGGLHAVELARALDIPRVLIPRDAGVFSGYGMVLADVTRDISRTLLVPADRMKRKDLDSILEAMAREGIEELTSEGIDPDRISVVPSLEMRYKGQSYEISVPLSRDPVTAFHEAHEKRYGYSRRESQVEVVTVRARLVAPTNRPPTKPSRSPGRDASEGVVGRRPIVHRGQEVEALIVDRARLGTGADGRSVLDDLRSHRESDGYRRVRKHVNYSGVIFSIDTLGKGG